MAAVAEQRGKGAVGVTRFDAQPEVGALTMRELLRGARRIAAELPVAGVEVVEVAAAYDPSGITAVNAHRMVLEILSGRALARSGRAPELKHDGRPHV